MERKKQVARVLKKQWRAYCAGSSLHGLAYLGAPRSAGGLVWMLVVAVCFALCVFLWHMIWHKFVTDPTFTVVESIHYLTSSVAFPAVSVCDAELVYGPNTRNITNILKSRNFDDQHIAAFYHSFTRMRQKEYIPEPFLKKMYSVLEDLGITVDEFFDTVKKPCAQLVVECTWRTRRQRCADLFRPIAALTGHCCVFDLHYFRDHADNVTNFIAGTEINEALKITLDTKTILHDSSKTSSNTLLYIFDARDRAGLLNGGETLPPASYIEVNLDVWLIDSSENVKSLRLDERKCTIDKEKHFGPNCLDGLVLDNIIKQCQCVPFGYKPDFTAASPAYPPCGWDRLMCAYQTLEREKTNIRGTIATNKCYEKCDFVQYDTRVEYLRDCRTGSAGSNTTLVVKFAASTCIKYRREVLYTWDQMLANLGGVFGLCLGGSIISIIELLWCGGEALCAVVSAATTRVREQKAPTTLFTITHKQLRKKNKKHLKLYSKYDHVAYLH